MAANTLNELIKTIEPGEDGDQAYRRLYATQTKPCDFRRWFAAVQRDKSSPEIDEKLNGEITQYVSEGMTVEEAFRQHCPDYVGPGEFSVAYDKEVRARKPASPQPAAAPKAAKPQKPVPVATPAAQGEYEGVRASGETPAG